MLEGKVVLITGGCGSFGTAMTKRLLKEEVKQVILFNRNEKSQWESSQIFQDESRVKHIIGDIRDYWSIKEATMGVDYVMHAAALKHIDKCRQNPLECIETNVNGSKNVFIASIENNVERVVFLSTDKAANAETIYGASKYCMEQMALNQPSHNTEVVVTRYGNVLGSNGSVIQLFKSLARENKPLTITDRNITRFFMSMDEAVDLVLFALLQADDKSLVVFNNKAATVGDIADCISSNQVIMDRTKRGYEKDGEALLTVAELNSSILIDNKYFVVRKGLMSKKHYKKPLTSDNAKRYNLKELKDLIDRC